MDQKNIQAKGEESISFGKDFSVPHCKKWVPRSEGFAKKIGWMNIIDFPYHHCGAMYQISASNSQFGFSEFLMNFFIMVRTLTRAY